MGVTLDLIIFDSGGARGRHLFRPSTIGSGVVFVYPHVLAVVREKEKWFILTAPNQFSLFFLSGFEIKSRRGLTCCSRRA